MWQDNRERESIRRPRENANTYLNTAKIHYNTTLYFGVALGCLLCGFFATVFLWQAGYNATPVASATFALCFLSVVLYTLCFMQDDRRQEQTSQTPNSPHRNTSPVYTTTTLTFSKSGEFIGCSDSARQVMQENGFLFCDQFEDVAHTILTRRVKAPANIKKHILNVCKSYSDTSPVYYEIIQSDEGKIYFCSFLEQTNRKDIFCTFFDVSNVYDHIMTFGKAQIALKDTIHDLNNVLAIIDGYSRLNSNADDLPESIRQNTYKIIEASARGHKNIQKINSIIEWSGQNVFFESVNARSSASGSEYSVKQDKPEISDSSTHCEERDKLPCFENASAFIVHDEVEIREDILAAVKNLGMNARAFHDMNTALSQQEDINHPIDFVFIQGATKLHSAQKSAQMFSALRPEAHVIFTGALSEMDEMRLPNACVLHDWQDKKIILSVLSECMRRKRRAERGESDYSQINTYQEA